MNIRKRGNNETILETESIEILFSYTTPVAGFIKGKGAFKTDTYYSVTTSKHINRYIKDLGVNKVTTLTQEEINKLKESFM